MGAWISPAEWSREGHSGQGGRMEESQSLFPTLQQKDLLFMWNHEQQAILTWRKEVEESIFSGLPFHLQRETHCWAEFIPKKLIARWFCVQRQNLHRVHVILKQILSDVIKPAYCSRERQNHWDEQHQVLESLCRAIEVQGCISACQMGRSWKPLDSWERRWHLSKQPQFCCLGQKLSKIVFLQKPLWNPQWLP